MSETAEEISVSEVALPFWFEKLIPQKRYKAIRGGRGSSKSWTIAAVILLLASEQPLLVLCVREFQKSIENSVHKLLKDTIVRLGLSDFYRITDNRIYGANGSEFIFGGLHANVSSIKSLEGCDICWVEEAETVSADSWKNLIPTIRKAGAEIWISYNPREPDDPTSLLVESLLTREDAVVLDVNFSENPWFDQTSLKADMEAAYRTDPEEAAHVWGGQFRKRNDAQIYGGKYMKQDFEVPHVRKLIGRDTENKPVYRLVPDEGWDGPYYGCDWGFSNDLLVGLKCWLRGATLYVEYESTGLKVELNAIASKFFDELPGLDQGYEMRADNSRPETISHVRSMGVNVVAAEKWPGSVEDGIAFIRALDKVIVHSRCVVTLEEFKKYMYKVDKITKQVTRVPVDAFNHAMDTIRYVLQPAIKAIDVSMVVELGNDMSELTAFENDFPEGF